MTAFNIEGIGSYDYNQLLEKKRDGRTLTQAEAQYLLTFSEMAYANEITILDYLNDSELGTPGQDIYATCAQILGANPDDADNDGLSELRDVFFIVKSWAQNMLGGSTPPPSSVAPAYNPGVWNANLSCSDADPRTLAVVYEEICRDKHLNDDQLKLILKHLGTHDCAAAMTNPMFADMTEDDYLALARIYSSQGLDGSEIEAALEKLLTQSVDSGARQFMLVSNDPQPLAITMGGVTYLYTIKGKNDSANLVTWTIEEINGQPTIVFNGNNLIITDASANGNQDDRVKIAGTNNQLKLMSGTNFGFLVGSYNSYLGGEGADTIYMNGNYNYADGWKGDDTFYVAGNHNAAYGFTGDDNFFVNGNYNFINGEDGKGDKVYIRGGSIGNDVRGKEGNILSVTGAPDFFTAYKPEAADPVETTVASVSLGSTAEGNINLTAGTAHTVSITIGTVKHEFKITSVTTQQIQYYINDDGTITLQGDGLTFSDVSESEFAKLNLKDASGKELKKPGSTFDLNAGATQTLAVLIGSTVYTINLTNNGTTNLSNLRFTLNNGQVNIEGSVGQSDLNISMPNAPSGFVININGSPAIIRNTFALNSSGAGSVTLGNVTFNLTGTANQAITYYLDANGNYVFEGNNISVGAPSPSLPNGKHVNIIGSGNTSTFTDNVKFNGADLIKTLPATGLSVAPGTHEYHFVYNNTVYIVNLSVSGNSAVPFGLSVVDGRLVINGDMSQISLASSGQNLPSGMNVRMTQSVSIPTGGTLNTVSIPGYGSIEIKGAAGTQVTYYLENGNLVISGTNLDVRPSSSASASLANIDIQGTGNIGAVGMKFNGKTPVTLSSSGLSVSVVAGTNEIHFSHNGSVYILKLSATTAGNVTLKLQGNQIIITGTGVSVLQGRLPDNVTATLGTSGGGTDPVDGSSYPVTLSEQTLTIGGVQFKVRRTSQPLGGVTASTSLSYSVSEDGSTITLTANGLTIEAVNSTAAVNVVIDGDGNTFIGKAGDDTIEVNGDYNTINAGNGNDTVRVTGANNKIDGQGGTGDTVILADDDYSNTLQGIETIKNSSDTVVGGTVTFTNGIATIPSGATALGYDIGVTASSTYTGTPSLTWFYNATTGQVELDGAGYTVTSPTTAMNVKIKGNYITYVGGSGTDMIEIASGATNVSINGGSGTDYVFGNVVNNFVKDVEAVNFIPVGTAALTYPDPLPEPYQSMRSRVEGIGAFVSYTGTLTLADVAAGYQKVSAASVTGVVVTLPSDARWGNTTMRATINFVNGVPDTATLANGAVYRVESVGGNYEIGGLATPATGYNRVSDNSATYTLAHPTNSGQYIIRSIVYNDNGSFTVTQKTVDASGAQVSGSAVQTWTVTLPANATDAVKATAKATLLAQGTFTNTAAGSLFGTTTGNMVITGLPSDSIYSYVAQAGASPVSGIINPSAPPVTPVTDPLAGNTITADYVYTACNKGSTGGNLTYSEVLTLYNTTADAKLKEILRYLQDTNVFNYIANGSSVVGISTNETITLAELRAALGTSALTTAGLTGLSNKVSTHASIWALLQQYSGSTSSSSTLTVTDTANITSERTLLIRALEAKQNATPPTITAAETTLLNYIRTLNASTRIDNIYNAIKANL